MSSKGKTKWQIILGTKQVLCFSHYYMHTFQFTSFFLSSADATPKPELVGKSPYTIMRLFLLMIRMMEATG